jgi:hypothetical protein
MSSNVSRGNGLTGSSLREGRFMAREFRLGIRYRQSYPIPENLDCVGLLSRQPGAKVPANFDSQNQEIEM